MVNSFHKSQIPNSKTGFGHWNLVIGHCLVIGIWLLVISALAIGCGDIISEVTSIEVSPSTATIGINQTQLFHTVAKNSVGQIVSVAPTWSVTGGIGTITSTGLFTAASTEGTGKVVATYGAVEGKAAVTVTVKGWLTGVIRTPELGYAQGIFVELKEDPSLMAQTDASGVYLISNIPAGTYEARTRETQTYLSASNEVTISSGETVTWTTTLSYKPGVTTSTMFTPTLP